MPILYRQADVSDASALSVCAARFFVESYQHVMERDELRGYVADFFTTDLQQAEITDPRATTFLAIENGIIGYAQIVEGNLPDCGINARKPAELKRIYVDHRWHGRGVAQELLKLIEQEAQRRACDQLWLAVWEINHRAISFYSKNGFRVIGRQGFPIGNEVQSDHVMARSLANELR